MPHDDWHRADGPPSVQVSTRTRLETWSLGGYRKTASAPKRLAAISKLGAGPCGSIKKQVDHHPPVNIELPENSIRPRLKVRALSRFSSTSAQ